MSIKNNQNGFVKNSISLSITIHIIVLGLLILSPQIKQLPIIENLIGSRTSTNFNIKSSLGSEEEEEVSVTYVEPEKNNIKKLNTKKESVKIKAAEPDKSNDGDVPAVPEDRLTKSKVKKALAKSDLNTEDKSLDKKNKPLAQNLDNKQEDKFKDDRLDINSLRNQDANKIAKTEPQKLIKNPNPPSEIDHTASLGTATGSVDGEAVRDGRKLIQIAGNPKPSYPERARLSKDEGTVLLKYLVTDSGFVEDIRVEKSSGSRELDDEAIDKVQRWKFEPGQAGETTHPVKFKLNGPGKEMPSRLRTSWNNG